MTAFWISAGLLTALALAILCWPLLRRRVSSQTSRRAINAAIYRDQLAELERDLQSGALSQQDYASARDELERRLLEDASDDGAATPAAAPRRLPRSALSLAITLPLAAVALYFVLGTPAALDPSAQKGAAPSQAEIDKMVATLAAKLEKNPGNAEGWLMLGRSYRVLGRLVDAARAYDKAGTLVESAPELMIEVAELSADMNNGKVEGKGQKYLRSVLEKQPDYPQALVLAGYDAFARGDFPRAVAYWEKLLAMVPPDSEDARNLSAGIAQARSQMGQAPSAPAKTQNKPASNKAASVSGRVELAPELKGQAAADDVVFIFARAAQGPRMPLAVVRAKVADLPMNFTLDDSMAMSPDAKLSSAAELRIEARISKSGDAMAKTGDLSGEITAVKPGAQGLKLVIDKTVP